MIQIESFMWHWIYVKYDLLCQIYKQYHFTNIIGFPKPLKVKVTKPKSNQLSI